MNNTKFLSLSTELLLTICDILDISNLKNLRLSCRFLAERLSFLVLSNICIKAETIEDLVSRLRFLTDPLSVAVNCTTRITIHGFRGDRDDLRVLRRVAHADRQKFRDDLFTAVTSLKAVRTVRWIPQKNDPLWFQESLWSAIGCLPALRALSVEADFLEINLENLDTFLALESISISGEPKYENLAALFENVSKLYASSPNLVSIEFDGSDDLSFVLPEQSDLYHLLAFRPKVDTAIRLRHLAVCNIPVRIDENTRHHLNNLTSLKLSLVDEASVSPPDEIWNAFRLSGIHLQELDIGYSAMGHAVNDYLSSFSGLNRLCLYIDPFDGPESLDTSAVKFWSNGFLNHVGTLQYFGVRTEYDGQWCFGDHNRSVIAKCTKLKQFIMSVCPSYIPTRESDPDRITPLIETVLTHMPHIEHFGLDVPLFVCYLGSRCGTAAWSTKSHLQRRLRDWISKYQPASRFRDRFAEVDLFVHDHDDGRKWLLNSAAG